MISHLGERCEKENAHIDILNYSHMIQLNEVAANPISFEYYVAVAAALFLLWFCLFIGILKFKNDEF